MQSDKKVNNFAFYLLPVALILFVFARFWHLTDSCLWFDEIFSIHAATNDFSIFFDFLAQDLIHPPFFYLLLKFWIAIFGESLLSVRLFPFTFSIIAIIPFYLLCRELKFSINEICFGLFAFAVNGSLIKYAQDVRMYSLFVCLSLFSFWLFVKFLNSEKKQFIGLLAINLLLIYTHYFGWLIIFAELCVVIFQKQKVKEFLLQTAILLISFTPWIYLVFNAWQKNQGLTQNIGWQNKPNLSEFFLAIHQSFYFAQSNTQTTSLLISIPILLICIGLAIFGIIKHRQDNRFQILGILFLVPFLVAFILGWILPISIWGIRHLTVIFVPYFLILAISIFSFDWKKFVFPVLALLLVISGIISFTQPSQVYIWCAWENLASKVEPNAKIYAFEDLVAYHLWFANKNAEIIKVNGYSDMPEDKAYFLPRGFDKIKQIDLNSLEGDKFWLAF
nr:glycosyltransferase family 39 protein [Pyrinomonadaceae bacterium]